MTLDHTPVLTSLVEHLLARDIIPFCAWDGEERIELPAADRSELAREAADAVADVETARLNCRFTDRGVRHTCSLLLVFGNDPAELVADYSCTEAAEALEDQLEVALDFFQQAWAGKAYPASTGAANDQAA